MMVSGADDVKLDKRDTVGPLWDGEKHTYRIWWFRMSSFLDQCGLRETRKGTNRALKNSGDPDESAEYEVINFVINTPLIKR